MMETLLRDLRYALRMLLRKPVFTGVAVLSLALGIGANTTIFSMVNELFLRPLPIAAPERVLAIFTTDEKNPGFSALSHLNWRDVRDQNESFTAVAGYDFVPISVTTGEEPSFVVGQMVSGNYFDALGVSAVHGRTFLAEEDAAPTPVVVVGYGFFTQHLGGDPAMVGQSLTLNGHPFTVVGVAPARFRGLNVGFEPELWVPMSMNPVFRPDQRLNWYEQRRGLFLFAFGRLRPEATVEGARANLRVLAERLEREYPDDNTGRRFDALPIAEASILPQIRGGVVAGTTLLMATVAIVLLIACANVANLLLARATERRREIAVRLALGVTRGRLVRQLLTESVAVALLGGSLGLLVAFLARRAILAALPNLPLGANLELQLQLDPTVLGFALVVSVATGLVFGLLPALQSSRPELVGSLKDQGEAAPGRWRRLNARNVLVVGQLALALVALLGSGLFLRSLIVAQRLDLGFPAAGLFSINFDVGLQGLDATRGELLFRELEERVAALPGVRAATVAQAGPLQGSILRSVILEQQESDQERTFVQVNSVGPGYFEVMEIPIAEGRAFVEGDRPGGPPVVIVNRTMAERFWPNQSALGQRFRFFGMEPVEVVGVARDIKYNAPGEQPQPYAYLPLLQEFATNVTLIGRAEGDPRPLLLLAEREVKSLAPGMPILARNTLADLLGNALFAPRFAATFLGILGLLALVLAAIGIYGVMSYLVGRRTREIGIRIAMGAETSSVLSLILREGLGLALVGLALGLAIGLATSRLLQNLLFVSPLDPIAYSATLLILLAVALIATFVPALRATTVDPIGVLRHE